MKPNAASFSIVLVLALTGCGGGGGGGGSGSSGGGAGTPTAVAPAKFGISLSQSSVMPADNVTATVTSSGQSAVDLNAIQLMAEVGQGVMVDVPFEIVSANQISFAAPMGVLASNKVDVGAGTVKLSIRASSTSSTVQPSDAADLSISAFSLPSAPTGELSRAYVVALRELLLRSIGNYALLGAKVPTLSASQITTITQQHNQQIDFLNQIIAAIDKAQKGGSTTVGNLSGVSITLNKQSLASLDQYMFSVFRIQPRVKTAQGPASSVRLAGVSVLRRGILGAGIGVGLADAQGSDLFDAKQLADDLAQAARDVAQRVRKGATTTLAVIGAVALVAGAPELALAAAGLAAVAWFTTTAAGATIGLSLQAGSSAILNGQASEKDFEATKDFVIDAYLEQAIGYVTSKGLKGALGDVWGSVANAGIKVAKTTKSFMQTDVQQAFQSGTIPTKGFSKSTFTLSVNASFGGGSSYTVVVTTSPAVSNAHVQVQISGTDGFRVSHNLTTVAGKASVGVPAGAAGVSDSINAYDIDGQAQAATTLVF